LTDCEFVSFLPNVESLHLEGALMRPSNGTGVSGRADEIVVGAFAVED
jgi:hypothetical protein